MSTRRTFGELIRDRRKSKGIGLRALADKLGYSAAYLSDVENGNRNPFSPDILVRIAEILDTPVGELLEAAHLSRGNYPLPVSTEAHNRVASLLSARWLALSDDQLGRILEVIS